MTPQSIHRIIRNLYTIVFKATAKEVHDEYTKVSNKTLPEGSYAIAWYDVSNKDQPTLFIDGLRQKASFRETLLHELGHAIDGPQFALSSNKQWRQAWEKELKTGILGEYAAENRCEGFAELFAHWHMANREKKFVLEILAPKCLKFFRKYNLIEKR